MLPAKPCSGVDMLTALQPLVMNGLLPMLGHWPADDWVLITQSSPQFSLAQTRALVGQRLSASLLALQSWLPLVDLIERQQVSIKDVIDAVLDAHWSKYAEACLQDFVVGLRQAQKSSDHPVNLKTILALWQGCTETHWPSVANATTPPAQILQVRTDTWVLTTASPQLLLWSQELANLFQNAGVLAAQLVSLPIHSQIKTRACIHTYNGAQLFAYEGPTERPILIVFATINRPDVLDIDPEHSLIGQLQSQGFKPYLIDWCDAAPQMQHFDDYVTTVTEQLLPAMLKHSQEKKAAVIGICQGGVIALNAVQLAVSKVQSLHLLVTPLQFDTPHDYLSQWAKRAHVKLNKSMHDSLHHNLHETISAGGLNLWFHYLKPYSLRIGKYLSWLIEPANAEALVLRLTMEHWLMCGPSLNLSALEQYQQDVVHKNELVKQVRKLSSQLPVQIIAATQDHIVPELSSVPAGIANTKIHAERVRTGHIGLLMGKTHKFVAQKIAEFAACHTANGLKTATVASEN